MEVIIIKLLEHSVLAALLILVIWFIVNRTQQKLDHINNTLYEITNIAEDIERISNISVSFLHALHHIRALETLITRLKPDDEIREHAETILSILKAIDASLRTLDTSTPPKQEE